jgi:vitamin B12 transporter
MLISIIQTWSESKDSVPSLEPIVVTASRIPSTYGDINRSLSIIDRQMIAALPVSGVADLLEYATGVDARQRGVFDVQSDISIRGGSFEQTLIMIDGVRMSEPQTGHHNMDLPITLDEIDRIEILHGPGSHLFGPNAFAGVINIITRQDTTLGIRAHLGAGNFGTYDASGSGSITLGPVSSRISAQKSLSEGFQAYTDFDVLKAGWSNRILLPFGIGTANVRYVDKDFGAYGYYSPSKPIEHEATRTTLANANVSWENSWLQVKPGFYSRWHQDTFWMKLTDTTSSANQHATVSYGGEVQARMSPWPLMGTTAVVLEAGQERIQSSNLGDRMRNRGGFCLEHRVRIGRLSFAPGAFISYNTGWGFTGWPGMDIGFDAASWCRIFGSVGQSYRVPTFTELYYNRLSPSVSPGALLGNPDLQPEKAVTYEVGAHAFQKWWDSRLSVYYRDGQNLIDWAQDPVDGIWKAGNVNHVKMKGADFSAGLFPSKMIPWIPIERVNASYAWVDGQRPITGYISRYVFDYLANQASGSITFAYLKHIRHSIILRYQQRINDKSVTLVDSRLSVNYHGLILYGEIVNMFDVPYRDIASVPLPGRIIRGGLNFEFKK